MRKTGLDGKQLPLSLPFARHLDCVGTAASLMASGRLKPPQQLPFSHSLLALLQGDRQSKNTHPLQFAATALTALTVLSELAMTTAEHTESRAYSLAGRGDVHREAQQDNALCVVEAQQLESRQIKTDAQLFQERAAATCLGNVCA